MGKLADSAALVMLLQVLTISCIKTANSPLIRHDPSCQDKIHYYRERWLETEEELMQCLELGEELRRNQIESAP